MTITNPFSSMLETNHTIQTRFVSFTRGRERIEDAILDVWVKLQDKSWTDPVILQSKEALNFPPLLITTDADGNITEDTQYAPSDLEMKVSGTGGTHKVLDTASSQPVLSGSFVSTMDWIDGSKFSLCGRLTNSDKKQLQGLYDVRFRAHVQFVDKNDAIQRSISYGNAQAMRVK